MRHRVSAHHLWMARHRLWHLLLLTGLLTLLALLSGLIVHQVAKHFLDAIDYHPHRIFSDLILIDTGNAGVFGNHQNAVYSLLHRSTLRKKYVYGDLNATRFCTLKDRRQ